MADETISPTSVSDRTEPVKGSDRTGGRRRENGRLKKRREKPARNERPAPTDGSKGRKVDVRV